MPEHASSGHDRDLYSDLPCDKRQPPGSTCPFEELSSGFDSGSLGVVVFLQPVNVMEKAREQFQAFPLYTLVITSVAGIALSGFGLLLLGFAHLLNPFGFAGLLILDAAFFLAAET